MNISRREQQKLRDRKRRAEKWASESVASGDGGPTACPSKHGIKSLDELKTIRDVPEVYLYCRESTKNQNLSNQSKGSRRFVEQRGMWVRRVWGDKAKDGKSLDPEERPELVKALNAARKRGIPLAFPGISRAIRGKAYDARWNPKAGPSEAEFGVFLEMTRGVELVTLNDPDADPSEDEVFLREITSVVKRVKVGRPKNKPAGYVKGRKERWKQSASRMRNDGMSYRRIAEEISQKEGISLSYGTVRKWLLFTSDLVPTFLSFGVGR